MRLIKTFILRLYTDSEQRQQICGNIRVLPGHKTFSFKNNSDLLTLLHRLVNMEGKDLPMVPPQDEIDSDLS